ncbi:MAG TPA: PEGA domain-containing protein [Polyangiaceae bacterium]|nr:PEGA domain-containing protein [Polyangiaceae bacterium]
MSSGFLSRRGAQVLLLLALLVALATGALAQSKDSSGKRLDAIRSEMDKGQGLYLAGNYAGAAEVFEAGYSAYPYSAFLFNAGVCYQKQNDVDRALAKFKEYVKVDPNAPDLDKVNQRIAALEAAKASALAAAAAALAAAPASDAGADADADAGASVPPPPPPVVLLPSGDDQNSMKSLVVIETEPDGAPLRIYQRLDPNARFSLSAATNPGWKEVVATKAPANLTLDVGHYHVVVEKFRDFNASEADMSVSPGHVHQLKANLSQGKFMAFLRVSSNVIGAHIWIDDKKKEHPLWGDTPHGELVPGGKHDVLVEAPGFEPFLSSVELEHGEQKELEVRMVRVNYGVLRIDASAPEVKVSIDKQAKGVWRSGEEPLDARFDAGEHTLTVSSDGRKTFEGKIVVPRGQILPLHVTMIPKYPRGPAWTQAIIGAAFLGAAIYVGSESNRLHDQLKTDRQNGSLEASDERATRGKWFAVGADAGFAIAGILGGLATYNFVKDPLPESSVKAGKLLEFDDPLKARPVARRAPRKLVPENAVAAQHGPRFELTPSASSNGGGLFFGGKF